MKQNLALNPIDHVLALIEKTFSKRPKAGEMVPLEASFGRVLSRPLVSHENVPEFAKSTVDGYAVKFFSTPTTFKLVGKAQMGKETDAVIREGECMYVPTGGMLPEGADTMVMIEDTEVLEDGRVAINKGVTERENIIERGSDMSIGKMVLDAGRVIGVHEIGAFASLGVYEVEVLSSPTVVILSTGDELVTSSAPLALGQIREINTYTLAASAQKLGFKVLLKGVLPDDQEVLRSQIKEAIEMADLVLISGGSSVGEKDYTQELLDDVCDQGVLLAGMAIKPGKPTILAKHGDKPVIGLPGHPVSAIVVFELLAKQILKTWGYQVPLSHAIPVKLTRAIYGAKGRDTFQMVHIENREGEWVAVPTSGKSGMITLLVNSNGYVMIPHEKRSYEADEIVDAYYF